MSLSDAAVGRLREAIREPDLSGTRYRFVGPVGAGGMGAVFEVEDEALARALLDEARVLARLEHPGLVPVHDAGRLADGRAFYAMKLVRGQRLLLALGSLFEPFHKGLDVGVALDRQVDLALVVGARRLELGGVDSDADQPFELAHERQGGLRVRRGGDVVRHRGP